MTKVEYFYADRWWARAHLAGCSDTRREAKREGSHSGLSSHGVITTGVETLKQLIEEVASDFIFMNDEQPWTDYEREVSVAPCLKLPRGE